MSNRNVEFFRTYLRVLGGRVSYVDTARALGISPDWIFKCLSASKAASKADEPSVFRFESEEGDGEPMWFHEHVRAAISMSVEAIEAAARSRALHGTFTPAQYKSQTQYRLNPDLIPLDDETLEMLGYRDRYLRDERGKLVPEMVWTPPSTDLVLGILGAHAKKYRKASAGAAITNIVGGIQVVGRPPAPQIAAPLPVIDVDPADYAEVDEPEPDSDEPEPETPAPAVDATRSERVDPGPRIAEPTPPEYVPGPNPLVQPRAGRALSELERSLLARLPKDNSGTRAAVKGK